MKIVNFEKFIKSICCILLMVFALSTICAKSTFSHKETEYTTIRVSKGDTLWSIAKNYGLTVDKLKDINNLSSNS